MPTCICAVVGCSNNTYHLRNWKLTFANYIIVTLVPAFAFVTLLSHSFHFRLRKRTRKEDKDGSRTLTEKIQIPENYGTLHTMTEHVQYTLLMENQLKKIQILVYTWDMTQLPCIKNHALVSSEENL
jgi:hypothetical protein